MFADNRKTPAATAQIRGSEKYSTINGRADFYDTYGGTIVVVEVQGIPEEAGSGFLGFHIHQGGSCTGNEEDAFADTGMHYNRATCSPLKRRRTALFLISSVN